MYAFPDFVRPQRLVNEHLPTVFYVAPFCHGLLQEQCPYGIVSQIVCDVLFCKQMVWDFRTTLDIRECPERSGIYYNLVFVHRFFVKIPVCKHSFLFCAGYETVVQS